MYSYSQLHSHSITPIQNTINNQNLQNNLKKDQNKNFESATLLNLFKQIDMVNPVTSCCMAIGED